MNIKRPPNHSRKIASFGALALVLFATVFLGLALRLGFAGILNIWPLGWDLMRAHSHLGYYGVLFPAAWLVLEGHKAWTPSDGVMRGYWGLVGLSGVGFLFQGYGRIAIAASTGVLGYWLYFAWRNRRHFRPLGRDWLGALTPAILLTALLIGLVAGFTRTDPQFAHQLARAFLTLLIFGIFVPISLKSLEIRPPVVWVWFACTVASAAFLTGLAARWSESWVWSWAWNWFLPWAWGLGLVGIGVWLLRGLLNQVLDVSHRTVDRGLLAHWFVFSIGTVLTGFGVIPHTHSYAIAGLHYLILGPLLMTLAHHLSLLQSSSVWIRVIYEASLILMVTSIVAHEGPALFAVWAPMGAAIGGAGILLALIAILVVRGHQSWRASERGVRR